MKQVVQSVARGALTVVEVPRPVPGPTEVLVATRRSLISSGTERAVRKLASANLLQKAQARPDLVRQVVRRARADGVGPTMRAVRSRLDGEMPLGYSAVGVATVVGEAVAGIRVGQRVATGSAGHAEYQVVPGHLVVPVPDAVTDEEAAFATVAAIALHGLRQADVRAGDRVCVIGLGLVGQLTARIALASGCDVVGIDVRSWCADLVGAAGALGLVECGDATTSRVLDWSGGMGVDAVVVTAATPSSGPVRRALELCRDRAVVVVVGDVGLELERAPFYEREIDLRFSRSYGPGRYDRSYEGWGVDYPVGYVRWTEGRNMAAFLSLVASGRLRVNDLVTHVYPIEQAGEAYARLEAGEETLGLQLSYDPDPVPTHAPVRLAARRKGGLRVGLIGAGSFARGVLVPALQAAGFDDFVTVGSASGLSARRLAETATFTRVAAAPEEVAADDDVDLVVIATRHDSHADYVVQALNAGKHVFCEKPLALTEEELAEVLLARRGSPGQLFVGFNRRHAPMVRTARQHLGDGGGPLVLTYRVSAGRLDSKHWYQDRRQGGRLLGEACHFVDTCQAIVGRPVTAVTALGSAREELLLTQDFCLVLGFDDGSTAAITYAANGSAGVRKERLEVLGRGRSVLIDDFRELHLDADRHKAATQDKGHYAEMSAVRDAIERGDGSLAETGIATTLVCFAAVESLATGAVVAPRPAGCVG